MNHSADSKKKKIVFPVVFYLLAIFILFPSCVSRISGEIDGDGAGEFTFSTSLQPRMSTLIRSLQSAGGSEGGGLVLDGTSIAQSMSASPGIKSVSFKNSGPAAIEGPIKITKIGDFLSPVPPSGAPVNANFSKFIIFEQNIRRGGGHCTISLSRESGPELLAGISQDVSDYLSALMAPLATGENLTKSEYLDLVASVYGKPIAGEITAAAINVSIGFPGPISSVDGGTWSGNKAEFTIPLLDLLVLETPIQYEVVWGVWR